MAGVDDARGQHGHHLRVKVSGQPGPLLLRQLLTFQQMDAFSRQLGQQNMIIQLVLAFVCKPQDLRIALSCCLGIILEGSGVFSPASALRSSLPTRTMKNSSRFDDTMARNFARSSREAPPGSFLQHPRVEAQPAQFPVQITPGFISSSDQSVGQCKQGDLRSVEQPHGHPPDRRKTPQAGADILRHPMHHGETGRFPSRGHPIAQAAVARRHIYRPQ